jgi:hypothetical protein
VDRTEDRRIRTDAGCQREHGRESECGRPSQQPDRVNGISDEGTHQSVSFRCARQGGEPQAGLVAHDANGFADDPAAGRSGAASAFDRSELFLDVPDDPFPIR